MRKNIAVILAGGSGERLGSDLPKQFLKVAGRSVLEHTVAVFHHHNEIDEIAIVIHPNYGYLAEDYILKNKWTKVKKILNGGEKRYDSSLSAIKAYESEEAVNLIFHDAVRPLVNNKIISDNIEALKKFNAVDTAVPSSDTIIRLDGRLHEIQEIPERAYLWKGQTPQSFKLETIREAYDAALKDPDFKATDDCGVVKKYLPEEQIKVVEGSQQNIKLTYKEDIYLLDKLFQLRSASVNREIRPELLKSKIIAVIGAREGIGAEIARLCKKNGIKVYSFSRGLTNTDVTDYESIESALSDVFRKEGRIDAVINTAGILSKEPFVLMEESKIDQLIDINLKGAVNAARAAYPYLKQTQGHLLFYTSSSYTRGRSFYSIYSATKAAIVNFVQALAEEWAADGIQVNCMNPERTNTPMRSSNFGLEPAETLLSAEEVAAVSLATLTTDYSGQVIDIKVNSVE